MYSLDQIVKGTVGITKSYISKFQASDELVKKRLDICRQCDSLKVIKNKITNSESFKCGKCGCYLKSKTRIEKEKCPKGLW